MELARLYCAMLSLALAVDKFVTPQKLPEVKRPDRPIVAPDDPSPSPSPPSQKCNCGCGRTGCTCGKSAASVCVEWDHAALEQIFAAKPAKRCQWLMFTGAWCGHCQVAKADFYVWLTQAGWKIDDTEAADIRLVDDAEHPELIEKFKVTQLPTFVLLVDGKERARHLSYPGRKRLTEGLAQARGALPKTESAPIVAGQKLKKEDVIKLREALLFARGGALENLEKSFDISGITGTIPANFGGKTTVDAADNLKFKFNKSLSARWMFLTQDADALMIPAANDSVTISLPAAPDFTIKAE